jgi:hypothetical protein
VNDETIRAITRRHFFEQAGFGVGASALFSLLEGESRASGSQYLNRPAKAKNIIYLFMAGAPSHMDLFDNKPKLRELDGQPCPPELLQGERFAFIEGVPTILGSPYEFDRYGASGTELSELLPHLAEVADDIAVVKSMHTTQFNHAPAQIFMNTGHQIVGRPSMGSWMTYGLGSENQDLPGFVVLLSGDNDPDGGKSCWGSGFLPTMHQGVEFRSRGAPVLYLDNPDGVSVESRRASLDTISRLNAERASAVGDPEIETRIAAYEMAYRMQTSVPELMDISGEPASIHELYGTEPGEASFANNCLLARRLVERGARFIQLYHWGWDHHGTSSTDDIATALPALCEQTDRASAALVKDLKQRGLLDETLIVWGGEFGRTAMNEGRNNSKFIGRDHHPRAFTVWLAGGGVIGGATVGRTDELGYNIIEDPVDVHDLHATVLHLMGIDHEKLTYRSQGRDFRLTDVYGNVVSKLIG